MTSSPSPRPTLTKLIGKAAWKNVLESLVSDPQQAKQPIPTSWSNSTVYPLHQAVSRSSTKPIPPSVLRALIKCHPPALDYYAFLGACENNRASIDVIETLLREASDKTLLTVQTRANDLCIAALRNDSADIVGMFCNRYPHLLKGDILYQACESGMPNCTEAILLSAQKHNASIVECLMGSRQDGSSSRSSNNSSLKKESPLEAANRLFDIKNPNRLATLTICVQHASASRTETGASDPTNGYPVEVAAIGWVSSQIYEDILRKSSSTKAVEGGGGRAGFVERCAIQKAMHMVYEKPDFDQIPEVFHNADLMAACRNRCPEKVRKILLLTKDKKINKSTSTPRRYVSRKHDGQNALDIAIEIYDENDDKSCEVLSICVKHINGIKMKLQSNTKTSEVYEYPTPFACVGFVPKNVLHSVFRKFKHEARANGNGKLAIKKLLYIGIGGGEYGNFANRHDKKYMFMTQGKGKETRQKQVTFMETIFEAHGSAA